MIYAIKLAMSSYKFRCAKKYNTHIIGAEIDTFNPRAVIIIFNLTSIKRKKRGEKKIDFDIFLQVEGTYKNFANTPAAISAHVKVA